MPSTLWLIASLGVGIGIGILVSRVGRIAVRTPMLRLFIQIVCDPKNQPHQWVGKPRGLWQALTDHKAKSSFLYSPEDYCSLLAPSETRRRLLAMYEKRDRLERGIEEAWQKSPRPLGVAAGLGDRLMEVERNIGVLEDRLVAIKTRSL